MLDANFWQDKNNLQKIIKEKKTILKILLNSYTIIQLKNLKI